MYKVKHILITLALVFGIGVLTPAVVYAEGIYGACDGIEGSSMVCDSKQDDLTKSDGFVARVIELLLMAVGIISVIMIIVGGIMYSLSAGDASKAAKARNTVISAAVGLVIAIMSYAIVQFVANQMGME